MILFLCLSATLFCIAVLCVAGGMPHCIVLCDVLLLVLSFPTMLPKILLFETDNDDDVCCSIHFS